MGRDWELGTTADYGRIEYAYYLMATRHAGIEISPSRLLLENGRAHFMTKRFDRVGNTKLTTDDRQRGEFDPVGFIPLGEVPMELALGCDLVFCHDMWMPTT